MATMAAPAMQMYPTGYRPIPVRIVSIFPQATTRKQLFAIKGWETFQIPAVKRGEFRILEVNDTYQWVRDLRGLGEDKPTPGMELLPSPAFARAQSLIVEWTHNTLAKHGKPGIAIVPMDMAVPDSASGQKPSDPGFEAFHAFLNQLIEQQSECFQSLITDANDWFHSGKSRDIQNIHREAAAWIYGDQAKALPWYRKDSFKAMKKCIGCGEEIKVEALRCAICSLDLVDYHMKYNLEAKDDDPHVGAMLATLRARKKVDVVPEENVGTNNPFPGQRPLVFDHDGTPGRESNLTNTQRKEMLKEANLRQVPYRTVIWEWAKKRKINAIMRDGSDVPKMEDPEGPEPPAEEPSQTTFEE